MNDTERWGQRKPFEAKIWNSNTSHILRDTYFMQHAESLINDNNFSRSLEHFSSVTRESLRGGRA
jgi:hypothetical protein